MLKSSNPPVWLTVLLAEVQQFSYAALYLAVAAEIFVHPHILLFVRILSISAAVAYLVLVYVHAAITFSKVIPKKISFLGTGLLVLLASGMPLLFVGLFTVYLAHGN